WRAYLMAWMAGAIAAASAANNTGKKRKRPNKLALIFTIVALLMGTFIPLGLFLINFNGGNFLSILMLIAFLMLIIGALVLTLAIVEPDHDEAEDDYHRESRPRMNYNQKPKPRWINNWENKPTESHYWGTEPQKFTKQYCTNCGVQLEANDIFCSSCGRRVN
ncbi:MAG: zinc-ribbon domain-containing protein, partial [Candidatus Hodarchaeota archaeon]